MTILFFARLFYPHIGGVETHMLEVGDRLRKKGHKIILVTEKLPDGSHRNWQKEINSANMAGEIESRLAFWDIYHIPVGKYGKNKKWQIWWWLWQHKGLIEKADIVHCHDVFFWYMPFRFLYRDKPVFTTFHGYETKFPPAKSAITIRWLSAMLSWGNICVGDFIKKWYGTKPDFVTYGGVDIEEIRKYQEGSYPVVNMRNEENKKNRESEEGGYLTSREGSKVNTNKIRKEEILIVFVGRLAQDTGILAYEETIEILNNKSKQKCNFIVLGNGDLKEKLSNLSTIVSNEQNIYPYIKNAQIVFTSSYLSILQALAMRKPVIAFYNNPLKEDYLKLSPFARWIAIENSSEKIAKKVLHILNEKESIAKTIKEAYFWVNEQTWDAVANLYLKLWDLKMK